MEDRIIADRKRKIVSIAEIQHDDFISFLKPDCFSWALQQKNSSSAFAKNPELYLAHIKATLFPEQNKLASIQDLFDLKQGLSTVNKYALKFETKVLSISGMTEEFKVAFFIHGINEDIKTLDKWAKISTTYCKVLKLALKIGTNPSCNLLRLIQSEEFDSEDMILFPQSSCLVVDQESGNTLSPIPIISKNKKDTSSSLYLPISILIRGQIFHTTALLDTGASHNFIDLRFTELAGWKFNPLAE